jgi:hypothetical protein
MRIYLNGERASRASSYKVNVSPAGHLKDTEACSEWVTEANEPKTFPVEFVYGVAEVPSNLGQYMVKYGLAQRSRLIIPEGVQLA